MSRDECPFCKSRRPQEPRTMLTSVKDVTTLCSHLDRVTAERDRYREAIKDARGLAERTIGQHDRMSLDDHRARMLTISGVLERALADTDRETTDE